MEYDTFDTLYSRDGSGRIRTFRMEINGADYRTITGLKDGGQTISGWTSAEGTNIGRSNQRLACAQAEFEIEAEYKKKLKRGYFKNEADVDTGVQTFPMLANKYKDLKKAIDFDEDVWAQLKFDGIRCLTTEITEMTTRKAEPIVTFPHILERAERIWKDYNVKLDGELYGHQYAENLMKINSIVRPKTVTEERLAEARTLKYYVYDVIDIDNPGLVQADRIALRNEIFAKFFLDDPYLINVETPLIRNQAELDAHYATARRLSFEGQIIRLNRTYQEKKRSAGLLKRKEYEDKEFPIVRIEPGTGNWAGAAKSVVCRDPENDNKEFAGGLTGSYEDNVKVLEEADEYVGGDATMRFFKYSIYGVPVQGTVQALYKGKRDV